MEWWPWLLVVVGLGILLAGAEALVRSAVGLAARAGISPLVVGLTVVAFATSAPELAVTAVAALEGTGELAFGNVVGSNVFNVLAILGLSSVIAPLIVDRKLVRFDVPVMIGVSVLVGLAGLDGKVGRGEGLLLLGGLAAYLTISVRSERARQHQNPGVRESGEAGSGAGRVHPAWLVIALLCGLGMLVLGSHWLVTGASQIARAAGISERIIGLTLVAAGTSLPELATSVVAAARGQREIAVGNIVGSNLFNLFCVLGAAAVILPVPVSPAALRLDVPVMVGSAVVCLPFFWTGLRLSRIEGALMLAGFLAYYGWLVVGPS